MQLFEINNFQSLTNITQIFQTNQVNILPAPVELIWFF